MGTATLYLLFIGGIAFYLWSLRGKLGKGKAKQRPDLPREETTPPHPPSQQPPAGFGPPQLP